MNGMSVILRNATEAIDAVTSLLARTLVAFAACASAAPALAAGELAGVEVSGTADYQYRPCVTDACDPANGNWHNSRAGGAGDSFAYVAWPGGVNSELGYSALAQLNGPLALPTLGAFGAAKTQFGTHPGYSSDCCYLNSVNTSAQALQYYTYTGAAPMLYTLTIELEGAFSGLDGSIQAGLTVWSGLNANGEMPLGSFIAGAAPISVTEETQGDFTRSESVSFTIDPGQGFYVSEYLLVSIPRLGEAFADASHTLSTDFTAGDKSLLAAALPPVAPVPEPTTLLLMSLGTVGLLLARRRSAGRA